MKIQHRLLNGENIHLGDFGYFLQSKGVDKSEDVNTATIESSKVYFVSGKDLEASLATAELKREKSAGYTGYRQQSGYMIR